MHDGKTCIILKRFYTKQVRGRFVLSDPSARRNGCIFKYDDDTIPDSVSLAVEIFQLIAAANNDIIADAGVMIDDRLADTGITTDTDRDFIAAQIR